MDNSEQLKWVDFVKGFAVLSVILIHTSTREFLNNTFAYVHIWQAVPLFVFISFFLFFRKLDKRSPNEWYRWTNVKKVIWRVVIPFIFLEAFFVLNIVHNENWSEIKSFILNGGFGRGSYYPYVYCQLWIMAPFLYRILLKMNLLRGGGVILIIAIALNFVLNSVIKLEQFPVRVESVLAVRYVFMAVIAYCFLREPDNKMFLFVLPIISVVYWLFCFKCDFRPWISTASPWSSQQFPSFFYTFLLVWLLRFITPKIPYKIREIVCWMGVNSWHIYLSQMLFFWVLPFPVFSGIMAFFHFGEITTSVVYVFVALFGSILPVTLYCWYEKTKRAIKCSPQSIVIK
jgi:surface polysaccharide O-acyltransferase-like enzyme